MFRKVLIANRGEIAIRIARSLREMGIQSVAVYTHADKHSPHPAHADEAYRLRGDTTRETYLDIDQLLDLALSTHAEAVIPGYGFLSENPEFIRACAARGIVFIGPSESCVRMMGDKLAAREAMQRAGVPIVPGGATHSVDEAIELSSRLGFPLFVKAARGGGGKGMRHVAHARELPSAWQRAQSEALAAFGDGTVYLEKALDRARHIEIQVLGDQRGNLVHLYERDCSVQRRHQKVIEETPAPELARGVVEQMAEAALKGARAVDYYSVGTFEFLVDGAQRFYFLEMNTRLQVEHAITELVTGIDLVEEMVRVAAGEPLRFTQQQIAPRGAAIECRVYAEDPTTLLPSPGRVDWLKLPAGPFVRNDCGVEVGSEVGASFDPLLGKLCVWGANREAALARLRRALAEYSVGPVVTNLRLLEWLTQAPTFASGAHDTGWLTEEYLGKLPASLLNPGPSGAPGYSDPTATVPPEETEPAAATLTLIAAAALLVAGAPKGAGLRPSPSAWKAEGRRESRQR